MASKIKRKSNLKVTGPKRSQSNVIKQSVKQKEKLYFKGEICVEKNS